MESQGASHLRRGVRWTGFRVAVAPGLRALKGAQHEGLDDAQALKGMSYSPLWGILLDFVPHLSGDTLAGIARRSCRSLQSEVRSPRLRRPRFLRVWTVDSPRRVWPQEHSARHQNTSLMTTAREDQVLLLSVPHSHRTRAGVERQKARKKQFDSVSHPCSEQILAYTLTLAELAGLQDALVSFKRYLKRPRPPIELRAQLKDFFVEPCFPILDQRLIPNNSLEPTAGSENAVVPCPPTSYPRMKWPGTFSR